MLLLGRGDDLSHQQEITYRNDEIRYRFVASKAQEYHLFDPVDLHWGLQLASTLSRFVTCAIVFCGLRLGTYDSNTARPKTRIPLVAFYDPLLACS